MAKFLSIFASELETFRSQGNALSTYLNPSINIRSLQMLYETRTRSHIKSELLHLYSKLADALWTRPHIKFWTPPYIFQACRCSLNQAAYQILNPSIYIPSLQILFEPGRISNSELLHIYSKLADALWTRPHTNSEPLQLYLKLADALWTRTRPHINSEPLHLYPKLGDAFWTHTRAENFRMEYP